MANENARTLIYKTINIIPAKTQTGFTFRNYYKCPSDGAKWIDSWTCRSNDSCPICGAEIEPYMSEDEDFRALVGK